ncbi:hypothetical protein FACS1894113_5370 [Alphaproteobacteria bacterium]|nr:hypothetical protein FACS1894113_5370 [Alphaproteobacteria bacterium]
MERIVVLSYEFIPHTWIAACEITDCLERFYGGAFADEFWFLNSPFISGYKNIEEWDDFAKTVDERLERYRQKRDYSFNNYYYKRHKEAMRTFHWNNTHYQLPRKNPHWIG